MSKVLHSGKYKISFPEQHHGDGPKLLFQTDEMELPTDCEEANTISTLFDLMNLNPNSELTDGLIVSTLILFSKSQKSLYFRSMIILFKIATQVHFMDAIKAKYDKNTRPDCLLTIESYKSIANYSLHSESINDILKCVDYFATSDETSNGRRLLLKHKDFQIKISSTFFYQKLRQFIAKNFYKIECYNTMNMEINYSGFLQICHRSREAFQFFCRYTARKMIEYDYPTSMQCFLSDFVFDIRLRKGSLSEFFKMYEDELLNYVLIISEILYNSGGGDEDGTDEAANIGSNPFILDMLRHLKQNKFENFVIIVTHFKEFSYLLRLENF